MSESPHVSLLHRLNVHGWLIMIGALLATLVSLRYWSFLPEPTELLTTGYLSVATPSQMILLAFVIGLLTLPILLIPFNKIRRVLYALALSAALTFLAIDTVVFSQYRFHINEVVMKLVMSGEVVSFSLSSWLIALSALSALVLFFYWLTRWLDQKPAVMKGSKGSWFTAAAVLALLVTHGAHVWASAYGIQAVTMTSRYLPLFEPATANRFMEKQGWIDLEAVRRQQALKLKKSGDLNYPRKELVSNSVNNPQDILLIVIDSWRADSFSPEITPNLWATSKNGTIYRNHYSSGNSTRAGIFGMFYGLPSPYWEAFLSARQSPVLTQQLQKQGYELGIFASAKLSQPEFDSTVFADIKNLRVRSDGNTPAERDEDLTRDWLNWYTTERDAEKPSFSFLFYDAPHGYDFPENYPYHFQPMLGEVNYLGIDRNTDPVPFINRYKNSVHYADSLIAKVLDTVKSEGKLDNTLLVVTGDHGQEFNDNGLNFWGHNSNFTDVQVKVPFFMVGAGVPESDDWSQSGSYTSHEDLAPTLLRNYLGLNNPTEDYATGLDIFSTPEQREWRMAAKYAGYAVIDKDSILEVTALGQYNLLDHGNKPLADAEINFKNVQEALDRLRRFTQ